MCGIAGIIDHRVDARLRHSLGVMLDGMLQRGPDGSGTYFDGPLAMGMRRLAVIDLVSGDQPLLSTDGQVVAFQNGEIYNYRALRRELEGLGCAFRSNGDTEVLAHGYAEWGIDGLLQRIDGMYAFSILDKRSGEVHLARDRFGEKPLFYAVSEGRFAWSSNLISLAALPWVNINTDKDALDDYLAVHYVTGPRTLFQGVRRLLPGHRMQLSVARPRPSVTRYYQPDLGQREAIAEDELAELLEVSVRSRLVADVPVGVFLSGGLDSSLITAIAARAQPGIMTFSMGFDSTAHDEAEHAQRVADYCGTQHHRFQFKSDSFHALVPQVAAELDEPLGDQAALPLYWLCREARKHVTVALSGEGADELFAGYGYYRQFLDETNRVKRWMLRLLARPHAREKELTRFTRNTIAITPSGFPLLTDVAGRERLIGASSDRDDGWEVALMAWLDTASDPHKRAMAADIRTWLPDDLLVKFDRMAMANSLEGRAPYLQPELAALALRSGSSAERMDAMGSKLALRRVAGRWLPQDILDRPKQGFVLPMKSWLTEWFQRHDGARAYFEGNRFPELNTDELIDLTTADLQVGVQRERLLFALVMLTEWYSAAHGRLTLQRKLAAADNAALSI